MFGMTLAGEMDRYGVTVNVICPSGLTRMTEDLSADFGSDEQQALKEKQATAHRTNEYMGGSPNNVAPIVSWLCSPDGRDVTGRVFLAQAGTNGFSMGDSFHVHDYISHEGENWTHGEVGECVQQLISQATKPTIFENAQKRLAARM